MFSIEHMFVDEAEKAEPGDPPMARLKAIEDELAELCGLANAIHGRMVELVGDALDAELWGGWGIHSPQHWVGWQTSMAPTSVKALVALARRRRELPLTTAALSEGTVSLAQAALIARHVPGSYEKSVMEFAPHATVSQLQRNLPRYGFDPNPRPKPDPDPDPDPAGAPADAPGGADTDGTADGAADGTNQPDLDPADAPADASGGDASPGPGGGPGRSRPIEERRDWSMGQDDDGSWWVSGHLPADEGALLNHAIKTARDDLFRQARNELPDGAPAPKVSLVDGLLALAETSLATGQALRPTSDRYRIYAHLEAGPNPTLGNPSSPNLLSWHLGPVLPDHLRRLHTCDATMRPVLERDGTPINLGREVHIVPRRIRRLIEHRDGGCRVPGCVRRHGLDIHHIIHWEHGGPTNTHNLVTLCRRHHRLHHLGGLQIWGNADRAGQPGGICFADQWGHKLQPSGQPKPPDLTNGHTTAAANTGTGTGTGTGVGTGSGLAEGARTGITADPYQHPTGERLDPTALYFWQDPNWTPPPPPADSESTAEPSGRAPDRSMLQTSRS